MEIAIKLTTYLTTMCLKTHQCRVYACKKLSLQKTVRVPRPLLYSRYPANPFQLAEAEHLGLRCNITMQYRLSQGLNGTVEFRIQYYNAIHGDCLVLHLLFRIQLHAVLKTDPET